MIAGRCECSKIKYQIDSVITDFSHCHCSQCRLHGAAFASFGAVEKASFAHCAAKLTLPIILPQTRIREFFVGIAGPIF